MLTKLMRLMQKVTGSLLGSLAVTIQAGNIMICITLILFGPDMILIHVPSPA